MRPLFVLWALYAYIPYFPGTNHALRTPQADAGGPRMLLI
jgi:hypothetical protein